MFLDPLIKTLIKFQQGISKIRENLRNNATNFKMNSSFARKMFINKTLKRFTKDHIKKVQSQQVEKAKTLQYSHGFLIISNIFVIGFYFLTRETNVNCKLWQLRYK